MRYKILDEVIPYECFDIGTSSYCRREDKRVEKSTGITKDYQQETEHGNGERRYI